MAIIKTYKRPKIMPYGFKIEPLAYNMCVEWCIEEFGHFEFEGDGRWTKRRQPYITNSRQDIGNASIYFANELDAMAFKLRWM